MTYQLKGSNPWPIENWDCGAIKQYDCSQDRLLPRGVDADNRLPPGPLHTVGATKYDIITMGCKIMGLCCIDNFFAIWHVERVRVAQSRILESGGVNLETRPDDLLPGISDTPLLPRKDDL